MSEIGLFASGYKRVSEYARSVDRLLLDLKSGVEPSEEVAAPVVKLLETMQSDVPVSPSLRLLRQRWQDRVGVTPAQIGQMVSELRAQKVGARTLDHLEGLAGLLDQERADMRFRLRGV